MFMHPDSMLQIFKARESQLLREAATVRLVKAARAHKHPRVKAGHDFELPWRNRASGVPETRSA